MTQKDYYAILGVARDATQDQIKRAYRKKAQTYHPDVNKAANAEAMMKRVNEAYDVLSDPQKKAQYDQFGSATGPNYQGYQGYGNAQYGSFEDLFAEMLRQQQRQAQQRKTVYRSGSVSVIGLALRVIYTMFVLQVVLNILMFLFRW